MPGNLDNSLSVGRTFNTVQATSTLTNGIFGLGWSASLPVDSAGADYIEMDVAITRDDVPVISHDPVLRSGKVIRELKKAQIPDAQKEMILGGNLTKLLKL